MIRCSICSAENHHLATVCAACGGFLQNRTENLDLFATCWSVLERPGRAFRTIALSRRKNGSTIVAAVSGIAMVFALFWAIAAAEYAPNTVSLFGAGFLSGVFVGPLMVLAYGVLFKAMATAQGRRVSLLNGYAVFSYALVPVLLSVILVFPLEIVAFGRYFFTAQPTPYSLRPMMYMVLVGLDALFSLWSLVLVCQGARVLLDASWSRTFLSVAVPLLLLGAGLTGCLRMFLPAGGAH